MDKKIQTHKLNLERKMLEKDDLKKKFFELMKNVLLSLFCKHRVFLKR